MEIHLMLAASFAAVLAARGALAGRRRSALNETLHELRRPLQALALAVPETRSGGSCAVESSLQMATAALARLDHQINGGAPPRSPSPIAIEPLLHSAAQRWGARVALAGGSLDLRGGAWGAFVEGDCLELSQALDNLIDNAIAHGGPAVVLAAARVPGAVRISVTDSGRLAGPTPSQPPVAGRAAGLRERLSGRARHGHGLAVVRRIATAHGGRFALSRSAGGSSATIELPLAAMAFAGAVEEPRASGAGEHRERERREAIV